MAEDKSLSSTDEIEESLSSGEIREANDEVSDESSLDIDQVVESRRRVTFPQDRSSKLQLARYSEMSRRSLFAASKSNRNSRMINTSGRFSIKYSTAEGDQGVSGALSICILLNVLATTTSYCILPSAFAKAGIILSSIALTLIYLLSHVTATYVMEACARAHYLADLKDPSTLRAAQIVAQQAHLYDSEIMELGQSESRLPGDYQTFPTTKLATRALKNDLPVIGDRKIELPELARIFLGANWRLLFLVTTSFDLIGLTWTIAAVFASSMTDLLPIDSFGDDSYRFYILLFAIVGIPLSCADVTEQLYMQMAFLLGRLLMVIVMVGTVAAAMTTNEPHFGDFTQGESVSTSTNDVNFIDISHFPTMLQIGFFSTAYQFIVPLMGETVRKKSTLPSIFVTAALLAFFAAITLNLMLTLYFGPTHLRASSNLNWIDYHGGTGVFDEKEGTLTGRSAFARMVSGFVVTYPAFDGICTFALCANTLGESIMEALLGDKVHDVSDLKRKAFRLIGCLPQLAGAFFVSDLGLVAKYAVLFTVTSYVVNPSLVAIASHRVMQNHDLPARTAYSTIFSSELAAGILCGIGFTAVCYAVIAGI